MLFIQIIFSFNNFIITDKSDVYYLNNNIRKYTGLFLSQYSKLQIEALVNEKKDALFLEYISQYPKNLLELSKLENEKSKFIIEIKNNGTIVEWFLGKKKRERNQKTIFKLENNEEILNFIKESKYILIDDEESFNFHNLYLTDCYGLKCLPVFKTNPKNKGLNVYNFEENKNFIIEPPNWNEINVDVNEIILNNYNYYNSNMTPTSYINKLLLNIFEVSLQQFTSN